VSRQGMFSGFLVSILLFVSSAVFPQSTPSTSPPASTPPPAAAAPAAAAPSPSSFSIEGDIFAYKALEAQSEAIACDVAASLHPTGSVGIPQAPNFQFPSGAGTACNGTAKTYASKVLMVSSTGATMANYQIWRMNMLLMKKLIERANSISTAAAPPDLTIATQVVALVQGVLGLFASNQTASGIVGSIPDQALENDVARNLRNLGVQVLMPDTYTSYALGGIDPTTSPFITTLEQLLIAHQTLQRTLQDNLAVANKEQKRQADKAAKSDVEAKLRIAKEEDKKALRQQLDALTAEITRFDRELQHVDVTAAQAAAAQAQSVISSIESFLAGLTGGSITFTSQTSSAPASPSAAAPAATPVAPAPPAQQQTAAAAPATPAASTTLPPISAALSADGLARALGIVGNSATLNPTGDWKLLWLKTLESGGALITTTSIFGSKVHFSGGSVAAYDLFGFDGSLSCSGVTFAYGGYVKASKFSKVYTAQNIDPRDQLIAKRGGCSP
jgi:hypothetical protein